MCCGIARTWVIVGRLFRKRFWRQQMQKSKIMCEMAKFNLWITKTVGLDTPFTTHTHKHMWRPTLLSKMIINILFLHKWFFVLKCASSLLFINVFYQAFERHILHCFCHHYWSYFNNLFAYYSTFILKQIFSHLLLQSLLSCRLIVSIFQMLQYFFYSKMPTIEETFCFQQCQSNMHNGTEIEEKMPRSW